MTDQQTAKRSTVTQNLPMVLEAQRPKPSLARNATAAAFVSQLLMGRQQMQVRAGKPRPINPALNAYAKGGNIAVLRLPQGYRKMVVV